MWAEQIAHYSAFSVEGKEVRSDANAKGGYRVYGWTDVLMYIVVKNNILAWV